MTRPRILVIAGGGLARFVPALGAAASIRAYHDDAEIILLTTPDLAAFAATAPYFNDLWIDDAQGWWDLAHLWPLRGRLRAAAFARVYDLEDSPRSARIFRLMHGGALSGAARAGIPWSGTVRGTRFAHADPSRAAMHVLDRLAAQLKLAGITETPRPDVSWVARRVEAFNVPFRMADSFVLMVGDGGPGTRWPDRNFAELARALEAQKTTPVLTGLAVPESLRAAATAAGAVDLSGRMSANELVFMAWAAAAAIGADGGVMHLIAAAGCRSVVLYDGASDPALTGQRGAAVSILRRPDLAQITVAEALGAMKPAEP